MDEVYVAYSMDEGGVAYLEAFDNLQAATHAHKSFTGEAVFDEEDDILLTGESRGGGVYLVKVKSKWEIPNG